MATQVISRAEARAQGLKRYFTGLPCGRGHIAERKVSSPSCVDCVNEDNRARRATGEFRAKRNETRNRSRENELAAAKRAADPTKSREKSRRHYSSHRVAEIERTAQWRRDNPEVAKASAAKSYAKWRSENVAHLREYHRQYYREKPNKHAAIHRRRAQKKDATGSHTAADLTELLTLQGHRCTYCRADLRKTKKHLDHVKPLSRGGSNDRTNLQFLCAPCNLSKGAKDPILFAQERGQLL